MRSWFSTRLLHIVYTLSTEVSIHNVNDHITQPGNVANCFTFHS